MSPESARIAAVIFDMDGVLCDSEDYMAEAGCRMFAETYGRLVRPEEFRPFQGAGEDRYLGGVAAKYDIEWDLERNKARAYAIYLEIIRGRLAPLTGAVEFVVTCRRRGLKLAVATSADKVKMIGNLREIRLPAETFDVCLTGNEVQHKKPHPEIFLTAAGGLGVPADRCLVVEDAPNGIRAAKAAGALCLALTTNHDVGELQPCGPDWIAADLASVPQEVLACMGE